MKGIKVIDVGTKLLIDSYKAAIELLTNAEVK